MCCWIRQANLNPVLPVKGATVMVEYELDEIGGKELHLPAAQHRHYASPNRKDVTSWDQIFDIYFPYETLLNDVAYTDYHKFSSETRMLRGLDVVPDATTSPASSDRKTGIANPPQCDLYPGLSRRPVDADEHGTLSLNEDNSA
jgi:hypothetical protein